MLDLIKKTIIYQHISNKKTINASLIFEEIIKKIKKIIIKKLNYVDECDKNDVYQEIIYKINICLKKYKITKYNYDIKFIRSLQEKYNKYNFTYYEYNLFCNEQQLYKYLNKLIVNTAYDYLRIKKKAYKDRTIKQQKLIKHKPNKENIYKNIIKYYANSESKNKQLILEFAFLFIENDKTFSETEVAQKLKVTRQAINKRKHKIFALIRQDTQNICLKNKKNTKLQSEK